MMVQMTR